MARTKAKIITERGPLGQLVVNIEFVVISVVQGVAISTIGVAAAAIADLSYLEYWPYVLTGVLFILFFWSEAISHTINFIDWPINPLHTFLYFLIGFFQIVAFSNLTDTLVWFWVFLIISFVGMALYIVDLKILRQQETQIASTDEGAMLFLDLLMEQKQGLYILVPLTIVFNVGTLCLLYFMPEIFLEGQWHAALAAAQGVVTGTALIISLRRFSARSEQITALYGSEADRLS